MLVTFLRWNVRLRTWFLTYQKSNVQVADILSKIISKMWLTFGNTLYFSKFWSHFFKEKKTFKNTLYIMGSVIFVSHYLSPYDGEFHLCENGDRKIIGKNGRKKRKINKILLLLYGQWMGYPTQRKVKR